MARQLDHARYYQVATFNGTTSDTTYVGGLFEVVSTSTGTTEYRHNIIADGQVIAVHTIDGNGAASTDYLHYDHLGSVDAITDDQGNVIQAMSFDAFGLRRDATNWDYDLSQNTIATLKNYTARGYTDQEELDNLSLVDLNGRVYDPTVGRFISADPMVPKPANVQAFNRYSYVYNNPLIYRDPTGYDLGIFGGFPGPQEGQDLSEMQQIQANPEYQLQQAEQGAAQAITFTGGAILAGGPLLSAATPGAEEAAPELADASATVFVATDVVAAFLNSASVTYGLTQGSADMLTSVTETDQVNVLDQAFGQNAGDLLTIGLSAWNLSNIVANPKSAQAAINALTEGVNFLIPNIQPKNTASSPPKNSSGGGASGGSSFSAGGGYNPWSNVPVIGGSSTNAGTPNIIPLGTVQVCGSKSSGKVQTCPT